VYLKNTLNKNMILFEYKLIVLKTLQLIRLCR